MTASFGIVSLPEDVAPIADEMIRAADEALAAGKRTGKNRVFEDMGPGRDGSQSRRAERHPTYGAKPPPDSP